MIKEIGSEFWDIPKKKEETIYLLSGRTALDFIIKDIIKSYKMTRVILPSYCCHTMIEPFVRNGIEVNFYDVFFEKGELRADIPVFMDNTILYVMYYFGFNKFNDLDIKKLKKTWSVVIEDKTHSWLASESEDADYSLVSYRKWFGIQALASAKKNAGPFLIKNSGIEYDEYCELRKKAFELKKNYICGIKNEKNEYLQLFREADELLKENYQMYSAPKESLSVFLNMDFEMIRERRIENAKFLINELKKIDGITLIYDVVDETDVPLFVPILVKNVRDKLRQYLIDKDIYLPVHWPLSDFHRGISNKAARIYDEELSVVCDQRYTMEDMSRIINSIRDFFEERTNESL